MLLASLLLFVTAPQGSGAPVVINEFSYDDTSTDDREFVELYNASAGPIDISGWVLGSEDQVGPNTAYTIPAGTVLPPGGFWVLGSALVPNVNQVTGTTNIWENDQESLTLRDAAGNVVDTLVYEANKGLWPTALFEGSPIWGNGFSQDLTETSWSRVRDGLDTGNNGFDFRTMPSTPGASNNRPPRRMNEIFDALPVGAAVPNWGTSFVLPTVVDPAVADAFNPQPIPPSPQGGLAAVFWDPAGGGNHTMFLADGVRDVHVEALVYFDGNPEAAGENETWTLGVAGSSGPFYNTPDPSNRFGFTANGDSGIGWLFQVTDQGGTLYFMDFNDGGWGPTATTQPVILGQVPIGPTGSGWHRLSITVDGNHVTGRFGGSFGQPNGTVFTGLAPTSRGSVYVGYREGLAVHAGVVRPFTADLMVIECRQSDVVRFGTATAISSGTPEIGMSGPPFLGSTANVTGARLLPSSLAFVALGLQRRAPIGLEPIGGIPGSGVWVDIITAPALPTTSNGTLSLPLAIAPDPNLCGVQLGAQLLQADFSLPNRLPLGHSKGLRLELGPMFPCPPNVSANPFTGTAQERVYERLAGSPSYPIALPSELGAIQGVTFAPPNDTANPYQPIRDYSATICTSNGLGFLQLNRPGAYLVEVTHSAPPFTSQFIASCLGGIAEGGVKQPEARYDNIATPTTQHVTVVERQNAGDNCFADGAAEALSGESRTNTVAGANTAIGTAYTNNGNQPVDVVLVGHGNVGTLTLGAGQGDGAERLNSGDIGVAGTRTQAFIDANKGKINCLTLFGCNVARGAAGQAFLQNLANALSTATVKATVKAYDQTVCSAKGWLIWSGTLSVTQGATLRSATGQ